MKPGIYRFRSIQESDRFITQKRIEEGIPYWEWDRYEYARLHTNFKSGIYKFRNLKEKADWEFTQVVKAWKRQT